ncbi:MAG: serine/threonine protein kinase [Planctomycetales bacterium]|nr:serine/threonine protein kinase [Planctomycetales bacterium]
MAKSRVGPFALESPLGVATSAGQVYRALHLEQKKSAALRVFTTPLGMTPESRKGFASQLEQLKQLRHPGIVRCYGGGFDSKKAYLAYEFIDGESLEKLIGRRERLGWEFVLDYSQQLAEALQYAHQMGWVHGRIRPDKILLNKEGQIKISDWRRDAISAMINIGPPNLDQLLYAAPEVVSGQIPDEKAELYSLGAVMYFMLTGNPPLEASSIDVLRQRVASDTPASVSSEVLDCPVWLSAIVDQLLAKDVGKRPFSAAALQLAFKEARRRQAEGVGVLQHAAAGFSPLQMNVKREEAEKVLGIKPKKERVQNETPWLERPWVLISAFLLAVAAVVWFLLPLGENGLRQRAEGLLASEQWIDWNTARDGYLTELLERFPEGPHAQWANEQIDWVDMQEMERRLERDQRLGRPPASEAARRYMEAHSYEDFGDRLTALEKYRAIVRLLAGEQDVRPIINLARRQIRSIQQQSFDKNELAQLLSGKLDEASRAYEQGDVIGAQGIWESIVSLYAGNQEMSPLVERAQAQLDTIRKR